MKIVFMGSSEFAVASLVALMESSHKVELVLAQPDKPAGRGQKLSSCPVAEFAKENNLALFQPAKLKNNAELLEQLEQLKPDVIIVVAYGKILPVEILNVPTKGCINVHASLLPKYRGAAPINWAIINGENKTGVTTMYINERMDEGDILLQCATEIQAHDTSITLHDHLAVMGADLLLKTLDRIKTGDLKGEPQNHAEATYAPILKKEDGLIGWNLSAQEIYNRIRGLLPWPKAYTFLPCGAQLAIFDAAVIQEGDRLLFSEKSSLSPSTSGTVVDIKQGITVATGNGLLFLIEVQLAGKKRLPAAEFVRGYKLKVGDKL